MLRRKAQQLSFLMTICGGALLALSAIPFTIKAQVNSCSSRDYTTLHKDISAECNKL